MKEKIEKIEILSPSEFKKASKLIKEAKENAKYEYGCIMAVVDQKVQRPGLNIAHLYKPEDDRYGIESEQHCTLLYGLHADIDEKEVVKFLACLKMPTIELIGIGIFSNPEFDVVKYDVVSPLLTIGNELTTKLFPFTSNFPDYKPHLTIAYMLPGTGGEYAKTFDEPIPLPVTAWIYSQANGKKIEIDANGSALVLREARDE